MDTSVLGVVQGVILTLAAIVGAVVAIVGLRTWRAQLKGNTEYDLSRRLLKAIYRVRDELDYVRRPLITWGEIAAAAQEAGIDKPELNPTDKRIDAAVRARRWKYLQEALSAMDVEELEAEVIWGSLAKESIANLRTCVQQLRRAEMELELRKDDMETPTDRGRIVELRRVLNGSGDADDEFANGVRSAVQVAEGFLRPRLKL